MPSKSPMPMVSEDAVRTRAYLMWEADGRPDGRADYYWDRAYAEVVRPAKSSRTTADAKSSMPEKKAKPAKSAKEPAKAKKAAAKPAGRPKS